jgi:porphobilinogen synthase
MPKAKISPFSAPDTRLPAAPAAAGPGLSPTVRMRRIRSADGVRRLVAEHKLSADDFIWRIFVAAGANAR